VAGLEKLSEPNVMYIFLFHDPHEKSVFILRIIFKILHRMSKYVMVYVYFQLRNAAF